MNNSETSFKNKNKIYYGLELPANDLIFSLFLFIVGLAIPFSLAKYRQGNPHTNFKSAYARIITRTLLLFGLFYWLIDYKGYKKWAFPFIVIGMNAITIYVVQALFDFGILVNTLIHGFVGRMGNFGEAFFFICMLSIKWLFLYFLYKKKIFLKV